MTDRHDVTCPRRETDRCLRNARGIGTGARLDPMETHGDMGTQSGRDIAMSDEHVKGTLNKARGKAEEGLGKVTGNKQEQVRGKARQVQGSAQKGLGDVQDTVRKPKNRP